MVTLHFDSPALAQHKRQAQGSRGIQQPGEGREPGQAQGPGEAHTPRQAQGPTDRAIRARDVAANVADPEIPVLTIADLGVLRDVRVDGERVTVDITPTYSGCPAMDAIRDDIILALTAEGFADVEVRLVLSPAWTTDWMSEDGKRKLVEYGIAPPSGRAALRQAQGPRHGGPIPVRLAVKCPRCGSLDTREVSRFGSTSCKALFECRTCLEPFDHFKVI